MKYNSFFFLSQASTNPFSQLKLFNVPNLPPPAPNAFIQLVPGTRPPTQPNPLHKLTPPSQPSKGKKESSKYLNKLKDLNMSVSDWIAQHVKKNPHIDLTPVFEDYKKYMSELEENEDKENVNKGGAQDMGRAPEEGGAMDEGEVSEEGGAIEEEEEEDEETEEQMNEEDPQGIYCLLYIYCTQHGKQKLCTYS